MAVESALKKAFPGGAYKPGDKFQMGTRTDAATEVVALLRERGVKLRE